MYYILGESWIKKKKRSVAQPLKKYPNCEEGDGIELACTMTVKCAEYYGKSIYPWPIGEVSLEKTVLELNRNWWIRISHLQSAALSHI